MKRTLHLIMRYALTVCLLCGIGMAQYEIHIQPQGKTQYTFFRNVPTSQTSGNSGTVWVFQPNSQTEQLVLYVTSSGASGGSIIPNVQVFATGDPLVPNYVGQTANWVSMSLTCSPLPNNSQHAIIRTNLCTTVVNSASQVAVYLQTNNVVNGNITFTMLQQPTASVVYVKGIEGAAAIGTQASTYPPVITGTQEQVLGSIQYSISAVLDTNCGSSTLCNMEDVASMLEGSDSSGGIHAYHDFICPVTTPISINTATTTQIIAGTFGNKNIKICHIDLLPVAADNVAMVEGSGGTCTSPIAMIGGTTAATGWNLLAGQMLDKTSARPLFSTTVTGNNVCLITSAATQLSGSVNWAYAPY